MGRSTEASNQQLPGSGDTKAWRHFGDGNAGELSAARIQGYDSGSLAYVDVAVDSSGQIKTASSGGGGAVTIADGADVAQGTTTDLSTASTVVGILKAIKAAITGTLTTTTSWASPQHVIVDTAPSTAVTGSVTATLAAETTKVIGTVNVASGQNVALAAGSQVIGHVVVDTAPSTAVTNAGTFAVQAAATLAAETTKVIGTVNQGTSPWVVGAHAVTNAGTFAVQQTKPATGTTSSPASVTTSVATVLAANAARYGATVYNESGAVCYLKLGSAVSLTDYTLQIAVGGYYEVPFSYTGIITGITSSGTAVLRVTEIST